MTLMPELWYGNIMTNFRSVSPTRRNNTGYVLTVTQNWLVYFVCFRLNYICETPTIITSFYGDTFKIVILPTVCYQTFPGRAKRGEIIPLRLRFAFASIIKLKLYQKILLSADTKCCFEFIPFVSNRFSYWFLARLKPKEYKFFWLLSIPPRSGLPKSHILLKWSLKVTHVAETKLMHKLGHFGPLLFFIIFFIYIVIL